MSNAKSYKELISENNQLRKRIKELEKRLHNNPHLNNKKHATATYMETIADHIPALMAYISIKDLTYLYVNNTYAKVFRIKKKDIPGKHISEVIGDENFKFAKKYLREVKKGKATSYVNVFNINGQERWAKVNYIPDLNEKNKVIGIIVLTYDITENKLVEEKLKKSENRYKEIIELAADGILLGNSNGIISDANQAMLKITGRKLNELVGLHVRELFPKADLRNNPLKIDLLRKGKLVQSQRNILRPDKKRIPVYMHSKMMPDGTFQAIIHDITSKIKSEEILIESKEKYRAFSEATSEAVLISENGICIEQNSVAQKMFGYTDKEISGKNILDLVAPEDKKIVFRNIKQKYESPYEVNALRKDGSEFPVLITPRMMKYKGQKYRFTNIVDITYLKKAENELLKNQEFLSKAEEVAKFGNWYYSTTDNIFRASRGAKIIYGIKGNSFTPEEIRSLRLKEYHTIIDQAMDNLIKKGLPYDIDFRIKRKIDNQIIDINSLAEYDKKNKLVFGVIQDITKQKRAEEKLREREKFLETLVENLPIMAFVKDAKTLKFISIN